MSPPHPDRDGTATSSQTRKRRNARPPQHLADHLPKASAADLLRGTAPRMFKGRKRVVNRRRSTRSPTQYARSADAGHWRRLQRLCPGLKRVGLPHGRRPRKPFRLTFMATAHSDSFARSLLADPLRKRKNKKKKNKKRMMPRKRRW